MFFTVSLGGPYYVCICREKNIYTKKIGEKALLKEFNQFWLNTI